MVRLTAHEHGIPLDVTDLELADRGRIALAQQAKAINHVLASEPTVDFDLQAVRVEEGGKAGWLPVDGPNGVGPRYGPPQARTVQWSADVDVSPEAVPVQGVPHPSGAMTHMVPILTRANGGAVRCLHGFSEPVLVTAYRDNGETLQYSKAASIDDGEAEVWVYPDTAMLLIRRLENTDRGYAEYEVDA